MDCTDGCFLFLYTDGLVESENLAGEAFRMDRSEALLGMVRDGALEAPWSGSRREVRQFRGGQGGRGRRDAAARSAWGLQVAVKFPGPRPRGVGRKAPWPGRQRADARRRDSGQRWDVKVPRPRKG
jgi:hypothetical protein